MAVATETTEQVSSHKNEKVGEVISTKMTKTIVVEVTRRVAHPVYKRIVQKRKKFYVHDEQSAANVGDFVRIIECRPLSRLKRWELKTILRQAVQVAVDHPALSADADTRVKKTIKKNNRYLATELPHPFENRAQYERSLRVPIGPEWTTKKDFQDGVKPRILLKQGIVRAIAKPVA